MRLTCIFDLPRIGLNINMISKVRTDFYIALTVCLALYVYYSFCLHNSSSRYCYCPSSTVEKLKCRVMSLPLATQQVAEQPSESAMLYLLSKLSSFSEGSGDNVESWFRSSVLGVLQMHGHAQNQVAIYWTPSNQEFCFFVVILSCHIFYNEYLWIFC